MLTDSDVENNIKPIINMEEIKEDPPMNLSPEPMRDQENPGIGHMIRKFWSKYIYNGFVDFYNKGKGVISGDENEELGHRMYEEYPEFHNNNECDLMKDMNQHKDFEDDSDVNFGMEIDGLERLC